MITREQARDLAVRYGAWCQAVETIGCPNPDWSGVRCWGKMLRDSENETGVYLTDAFSRDRLILSADRNLAEKAVAA